MDWSRNAVERLTEVRAEFDGLAKALKEQMGESAPAMLGMRQAIDDCQLLPQQILQLNARTSLAEAIPDPASEIGHRTGRSHGRNRFGVRRDRAATHHPRPDLRPAHRGGQCGFARLEPHQPDPLLTGACRQPRGLCPSCARRKVSFAITMS